MKAIIEVNVPDFQIGQEVSIYFKDTMMIKGIVQEPKTGHWKKTPKAVMGEGYMWYCDKCEHQVYQDSSRPYPSERYCPNCGAKMVEPQETETWNGIHAQITAPKGTFERIFNEADDDNDI